MTGRYPSLSLGILACLGLGLAAADRVIPPSRLISAAAEHDFGVAYPNQELRHSFRLIQSGLRQPRIERVVSSCGCLSASLRRESGAWVLDMAMTTEYRLGPKTASAIIFTNAEKLVFELRCEVVSPLKINPLSINFGDVEASRASETTFELTVEQGTAPAGVPELTIVDRVDPPTVIAIRHPTDPSRYSLKLRDKLPVGPLTSRARFTFRRGAAAPMEFPIRGLIVGDAQANPIELFLLWENPSQPFRARAELLGDEKSVSSRFQIVNLFGDLSGRDDLGVVLTEEGTSTFLDVSLTPSRNWNPGDQRKGVAQVATEGGRLINVPITINVSAG